MILELQRTEQKFAAIRDFVEVRLGLKVLSMDYNYYHSQEDSVQRCNQASEKLQRLVYLLMTKERGRGGEGERGRGGRKVSEKSFDVL